MGAGGIPSSGVPPLSLLTRGRAMTMCATSVMRSVRATLALLVLGATAASSVVAAKPIRPTRPRAMNLFSSAGYLFQVNRQQCGLKNDGEVCVGDWEGDPVAVSGREHPMGIAVDQRILGWNFPSGNEDIICVICTFYNITARSSSGKYNNPSIPGPLQAEIAAIGDQFQDINENKFKIQIPDDGYTIDALYAAAAMDADVAVFSQNYATAIVPF